MGSVGRIGDDLVVRGPASMKIVPSDARSPRLVRFRVWLASAMWLPVLAANLVAIALGITLPFLDEILGDEPRLPIALPPVERKRFFEPSEFMIQSEDSKRSSSLFTQRRV